MKLNVTGRNLSKEKSLQIKDEFQKQCLIKGLKQEKAVGLDNPTANLKSRKHPY